MSQLSTPIDTQAPGWIADEPRAKPTQNFMRSPWVAPRKGEGVELEIEPLVLGGHPGVADQQRGAGLARRRCGGSGGGCGRHAPFCPRSHTRWSHRHVDSATGLRHDFRPENRRFSAFPAIVPETLVFGA